MNNNSWYDFCDIFELKSEKDIQKYLNDGVYVHAADDILLRMGSEKGYTDVVKVLLDNGANVHIYDDQPLRYASHNGHSDIVKLLIECGADVSAQNNYALRWAISKGHTKVVKLLLEAGADVNIINDTTLRYLNSSNNEMYQLSKIYKNGNKRNYLKIIKQKLKEFFKV